MGWAEFIAAFAVFFLTHMIPVRPPVKPWLVARLGQRGFTIGYSILSLGVLAWLIGAAGRAPYVGLWETSPWHKGLALGIMCLVCLILTLSIGRPNPFSFGGPVSGFDPARPGIVRWMRHPLLVALALWSGIHVLPNGDLAHVLVFGSFASFAVLGQVIIDRRRQREMGAAWQHILLQVAQSPILPKPADFPELRVRLALGVLLFGGLILLHPIVFGVTPLL